MKRLVSSFLIGMMVVSAGATFANTMTIEPILISESIHNENMIKENSVEEDQIVTTQIKGVIACELEGISAEVKNIEMILSPRLVGGVMMVPLAETLRTLGYTVVWNSETNSIDINKGAQWTSITLGKNAYFKNRMAPKPLSSMPISIDNHTFVPLEFFTDILDLGLAIENGNITINENMMAIHSGYVKSLESDETGALTITITKDMNSTEIADLTIIHTSTAYTYMNKQAVVGEMIHAITPPIMTMSLPGQTSAHVIY